MTDNKERVDNHMLTNSAGQFDMFKWVMSVAQAILVAGLFFIGQTLFDVNDRLARLEERSAMTSAQASDRYTASMAAADWRTQREITLRTEANLSRLDTQIDNLKDRVRELEAIQND